MASKLSNLCRTTNAARCTIHHCTHRVSISALSKVQQKVTSLHLYTTLILDLALCRYFLKKQCHFIFARQNLDDCNYTRHTSCIISELRRKVYATTYEILNIYGLLRCNMHISLERNTFWSQHKGTLAHTLSYNLLFRHDIFSASALVSGHTQFTQQNYVVMVS